ncbi:uncharacterized protein LOC116127680 isoform X2 [Pistacia vera]|uniref:uncharacterized protein LOC116127680 isoform X2 n=1 Tax=Pistacia vera TaxID=55513 RepID=UPI0012630655|nr:uncharacterized protein LOC116127680 isoform X2 [Pistacia vera]
MKDYTAALGSTSTAENVQIVIAPPYQKMDEIEKKNRHFQLCWAALEGDWNIAERIYKEDNIDTQVKLSKDGDTALHIAAAARRTGFVKKLLEQMNKDDLAIKNNAGNTAFFLAAASKRVEIVKAMMGKNEDVVKIRGDNDMLPLHKAALEGDKEMVEYLYEATGDELLDNNDRFHLLINLINHGLYDNEVKRDVIKRCPPMFGRQRMKERNELSLRDRMNERDELMNERKQRLGWGYRINETKRQLLYTGQEIPDSAFELVERLWKQVMLLDDSQILEIIRKPWSLIFEAAKQGNLRFLKKIFSTYPDLMFEVDENHYTILHFAVMYRRLNIFYFIYDIGRFKDMVVQDTDKEGNNILHLAAKLPPIDRPDIESPALHIQMQIDKWWFEEVKRITHPMYAEAKNKDGKTPRALFTEQHEELRNKADKYTKKIATACIMGSTLIATVVFAALFTLPGGTNENTGTPHFVRRASFIVFTISDTIALLLSSFSIIVFLAVISSRCEEADFLSRVPCNLALGLHLLLLSVKAVMVAFSATVFIVFKDGLLWTPVLLTIMVIFAIATYDGRAWTIYGEVMHYIYYNK